MAIKLFVTLEDLKDRMSINPELEGIDASLESAVIAAQLRVESFLDSQLDRKLNVSCFYLDKDSYSGIQPGKLFRLYLASGLVIESLPFTVVAGKTWNGVMDPVPASDYKVDAVRGIVYLDSAYADLYVAVSYTTGYTRASETPDWLKETILAYAPVVLNFSHTASATNKDTQDSYRMSGDHALAVAAPYTRNVGMVIRPLF